LNILAVAQNSFLEKKVKPLSDSKMKEGDGGEDFLDKLYEKVEKLEEDLRELAKILEEGESR